LTGIIGQCIPGAKIIDVCEFGTAVINAQTAKLFTKKVNGQAVDRGVAFPVCISVNDIVCNCSPLATEVLVRLLFVHSGCLIVRYWPNQPQQPTKKQTKLFLFGRYKYAMRRSLRMLSNEWQYRP
jgi:hypothetical protein